MAFTTSDDSKTTWMFSDQISSTSLTRDDAGVNKVQRYTPWGETRTVGGLETDHTYTGQIEDTTTGLKFYNARYMDPVLGRFVSPDTIVPNPSNGQDYNRYSYVLNNPIRYNDPSGHCSDYVPCEGDGPTTTDEADDATANTSFATRNGGAPDDGVPWYQALSDVIPGACITGTQGCDPNAGWAGAAKQDTVNFSAGVLDPMTGGLAEDFIYNDIHVDEGSRAFGLGNVSGTVAMLPAEFNPIGQVYSRGTSGTNALIDCNQYRSGGSGGDCAAALADVAIDGAVSRLGGLDSAPGPNGWARSGDGFGFDLGINWGNNMNHFTGFGSLNPLQSFTEILGSFASFGVESVANLPGAP